jgi:nitronate monooxygenase
MLFWFPVFSVPSVAESPFSGRKIIVSKFPTRFTSKVGIRYPIIQAPMAGGATTPELVAAVSNAGALGSFGAAMSTPTAIKESIARIRALTDKPFNVNLFVLGTPHPGEAELAEATQRLATFKQELGLEPAALPPRFCEDNRAQYDALLEAKPPVVSFAFDLLDRETIAALKRAGSIVISTATTAAEARACEAASVDFVCAQGFEAGGHRGTFLGDFENSAIGLMALVPQIADAVKIPVIAAGGIMDGRGIAAALALGAEAVQLGTAFLTCAESGIHPEYKQRLLSASDDSTRLTRTFSGRYARGIVNEFMERMRPYEKDVPAYPVQNALTADLRQAAIKQNRMEYYSMWAGQAAGLSRALPAAELVSRLVEETLPRLPAA